MAVNKMKLKTLNRISDQGFDTAKKIMSIDMRTAHEKGLVDDIGGIIDLQDAIRAHREIAYLCDGEDLRPRKEARDVGTEGDHSGNSGGQ